MGAKFSFADIFVFCVKLCLLQSIPLSFLWLNKTLLQFFLFITYFYQVCETYDGPQYLHFQQKHQYQPKPISLTLPRHLQILTLEFHLRLRCPIDHVMPKHYDLTRTLSILFPNVHIYALTFHFYLVNFR